MNIMIEILFMLSKKGENYRVMQQCLLLTTYTSIFSTVLEVNLPLNVGNPYVSALCFAFQSSYPRKPFGK